MKPFIPAVMILAALAASTSAQEPFVGNTLITPIRSTETFLIDMNFNVIQTWHGTNGAGHTVYLLPDGSVLRSQGDPASPIRGGGGAGGHLQRVNANDKTVWDYFFSSSERQQHHDIEPMPNGNVLVIAWEHKTREEAIAVGRTAPFGNEFLPTLLAELEPVGASGANVVWEWRILDHIIQDVDPAKPNYGVLADHPELVDINRGTGGSWDHANYVDYNPRLDQIVFSARGLNEVFVIDHSTTTEEAAGHSGGKSGKGGDILYRWGNPQNYGRGTEGDQVFWGVHGANWIDAGLPGAGGILAFNNGNRFGTANDYSSVVEIQPPMDRNGDYVIEGGQPFGPASPDWEYEARPGFYSVRYGSGFRLPNGNTLICEGVEGIIFEVTVTGERVWAYRVPRGAFAAQRYWPGRFRVAGVLDIRPGSCPNPFGIRHIDFATDSNPRRNGVLPVAVLGTDEFDVGDIDISTLRLEGVEPVMAKGGPKLGDIATVPEDHSGCICADEGPDGFEDLQMEFPAAEIMAVVTFGSPGEQTALTLTGALIDGRSFKAIDCVVFAGDTDGDVSTTGVDPMLSPAFPNPFNPVTRIGYVLPRPADVRLTVYDVQGKLVEQVAAGVKHAGEHFVEWDATGQSSGIYFYRLVAGDYTETRKMILLK